MTGASRVVLLGLLTLLALFTVGGRPRTLGEESVYVFERLIDAGGTRFLIAGVPTAPSLSGRLTVRFTRNAAGKIVDGPVQLTDLVIVLARPDVLLATFELVNPINATLQNGLMDFGSPMLSMTINTICTGYCTGVGIPEESASISMNVQVSGLSQVHLAGRSLSLPLEHQVIPFDLGFGQIEVNGGAYLQFLEQ